MQGHTLGKVGNLHIVLLRVYSHIILSIFIEIGSYLTEQEQKICWHSFFETWCIIFISYEFVYVSYICLSSDIAGNLMVKYYCTVAVHDC